ncbi:hypothetical protein A3C37_03515 [Candidatus Peribacteria bacterium RIFCSPHIGHO2_02_FULL_53_20]|nr:MAG: hypothetical protein A3C37_03515 [Candidatus Peribacteria bacterium RIFCSPHIGHO2_02_FULL_53_20]OGJ67764.1 MAG: hypothetical protein A3B61_01115 [Candidatus Peribacteria bacterium RIFCSPLOWO2_01_FULL_53_10]OGJ71857.1 MAG: hypothetical protein A3G69_04630 [Candidatus Peribacteria bacterium RIFCSPLOWO2_12_FULL_53_10]
MSSLPFGIAIASVFSVTSLLIVLFRVSPLTAPAQALPAFFVAVFLTVSTVGTIVFIVLWRFLPWHVWDTGKITAISLRQGLLLALAMTVILLFLVLRLLNWWIALLILGVFVLIELACRH